MHRSTVGNICKIAFTNRENNCLLSNMIPIDLSTINFKLKLHHQLVMPRGFDCHHNFRVIPHFSSSLLSLLTYEAKLGGLEKEKKQNPTYNHFCNSNFDRFEKNYHLLSTKTFCRKIIKFRNKKKRMWVNKTNDKKKFKFFNYRSRFEEKLYNMNFKMSPKFTLI